MIGFDTLRNGYGKTILQSIIYLCDRLLNQIIMFMFTLFIEGGPIFMAVLTLLLVAIFLAAWKAPAWVEELGKMALVFSVFSALLGLRQAADVIQKVGFVSPAVVWGGIKVMVIPILYGTIIDFISLVIRIIQKPRI
jgi:hypothetical protein